MAPISVLISITVVRSQPLEKVVCVDTLPLHFSSSKWFWTSEKVDFDTTVFILKILLFHLPKPPYGTFYNLNVPQERNLPCIYVLQISVCVCIVLKCICKRVLEVKIFCWLGGPPTGYDGEIMVMIVISRGVIKEKLLYLYSMFLEKNVLLSSFKISKKAL